MTNKSLASTLACLLFGIAGCASHAPGNLIQAPEAIAATFTKTAERVYSTDWIGFDEPIPDAFSTKDLSILSSQLPSLRSMIENALGLQDSVWGANLAGHFKISQVLPLLRYQFLTSRPCYGWEGPDYSDLESYLFDNQYQYSVAYLEAIEAIAGKPIAEAITLTPAESERVERHASSPDSEFYHWALWTKRKLRLTVKPN